MTIRYRTTGPWGAGLGANLSPSQVDENFWTLAEEIATWTAPAGVGVASISVSGIRMTIHLTDGSTQGPFNLPFSTFSYEGDWTAGTDYDAMSIFLVPDVGLYLVIQDGYHSATEFDPAASNTAGPYLREIIHIPSLPDTSSLQVSNLDEEFHLLSVDDAGMYLRMDYTGATTEASLQIGVPQDPAFPIGYWVSFRQTGTTQLEFVGEGTDVVINTPETLKTRKQHSTVTIAYMGANVWDLSGDLEAA